MVRRADPLSAAHRLELAELAHRLEGAPDADDTHLAARLRAVLAHAGPDLHRVIMAHVHEADAATLDAQVVALRAAAAAWTGTRAPYARGLSRDLAARADGARRDWLTLKRLLDARWHAGVDEPGEDGSER
jgi:hypothetical protein